MKKVGVIGAGVMGRGVAQNLLVDNYEVILVDLSTSILNSAKDEIMRSLRFQKMFNPKSEVGDIDKLINHIKATTELSELNDVDFIIENATEDVEIKKKIYTELSGIMKDECIVLVNTSCVSITKISSYVKHKQNIIGVHFMNPVYAKNTVEAIRGEHTSDDVIQKTEEFLQTIGKKAVIVNDYPGFVSNRISHLLMNEAAYVVQDQVATPEQVDTIFKKCFGHAMGPLETADLIGLDTVVNSLDVLYESYHDSKFRVCPLLQKMVYAGYLGRKSGKGFYEY